MHSAARTKNVPDQVMAFSSERNVDAIIVLTDLLATVAIDIPLARMGVVKTSEGISHAQGPIPTPKNAKYPRRPMIVKKLLLLSFAEEVEAAEENDSKSNARTNNDTTMPPKETKQSIRRPTWSTIFDATAVTMTFIVCSTIIVHAW